MVYGKAYESRTISWTSFELGTDDYSPLTVAVRTDRLQHAMYPLTWVLFVKFSENVRVVFVVPV